MQDFTVTSPNTCGLAIDGLSIFYINGLGNTIGVSNAYTFEQFTTPGLALTRAVAINPDFDGNPILGSLVLTPDNVSPTTLRPEVGTTVALSSTYTADQAGTTTFEYTWFKDDLLINGATTGTITSTLTAAMRGSYRCDVLAINSTNNTTGTASSHISVLEPLPFLDAADAIGGSDPYGSINTGRGDYTSGGDPLDLNFTFVTLIDTTYTQSQLELYVPETNTTIPYVTNLPAPYHFDSNGACFTGNDSFTMEIRLAANNQILGEVVVPGPQSTNDEIYFWNP